jgi:hypothetical protein
MPENSPLRADPVADVFVEKREDRHGITMKEFRDRFRRLMNAEFSAGE